MPRLLRRVAVIAASLLLAAAAVVVPASASSSLAAPRIVYIKQKDSSLRYVGVLGTAESRDPVNQLLTQQIWEMNVVTTYQGAWVVTLELYGSNLCLDKSLDTATTTNVYVYTCRGTANQRWLLQRTGSVTGANLHFIRTFYQGTPGNCLRTYSTGQSIVWNCADELDEYAIYVI